MGNAAEPSSLLFLGTGDSLGVPRVYCDCPVCAEARATGANVRLRSSALLETPEGPLLIDCGPDWRRQMETLGCRRTERVLLTHAHIDHIGGLPEWADACRWLGTKGRAYAPASVFDIVRRMYPWLETQLIYEPIDDGWSFGGWRVAPWRVNHGKNGHAYAYRFEGNGFRWAYCPDSIGLTGEQKQPLFGLDLLVLGTSYFREDAAYDTRSVYDIAEAAELLAEIEPGLTRFTHMSHGIDVRAGYLLPARSALASAGMRIQLAAR